MYYHKIEGHFNFEKVYDMALAEASNDSVLVEVGTYLGKSTCYMAERIKQLQYDIEFHAIDNFIGSPDDQKLLERIKQLGGDIFDLFLDNMKRAGVLDFIIPHRADSAEAAKLFEDESLDFVFIDAAHDYESVKKDIATWYPKVKTDGLLGGHDYGNRIPTGVDRAVQERFGSDFNLIENSWLHRKK